MQTLLRLRRENDALRDGKLWHLASDDSSYIFLRESDEEKLVIAFHDGRTRRQLNLSLQGTPAEAAAGISAIFGNGEADLAGQQLETGAAGADLYDFCVAVRRPLLRVDLGIER